MSTKGRAPQGELEQIDPGKVTAVVTSLRELSNKGKPESNLALKERIDDYFEFCANSGLRPGVETLRCALGGVSRTTFYEWSCGINCDAERQEIIQVAKSFIDAFIEQSVLSGLISPPSGIFLLKNWCGYRDSYSIEEKVEAIAEAQRGSKALTAAELPRLGQTDILKSPI